MNATLTMAIVFGIGSIMAGLGVIIYTLKSAALGEKKKEEEIQIKKGSYNALAPSKMQDLTRLDKRIPHDKRYENHSNVIRLGARNRRIRVEDFESFPSLK